MCDDEPNPNPTRPTPTLPADDPNWLELSRLYPKPDNPAKARSAFASILASGVDYGLILRGLKAFTARKTAEGKELRYWPDLARWLNERGWEDEDTEPAAPARPARIPYDQQCAIHYGEPADGCRPCAREQTRSSAA